MPSRQLPNASSHSNHRPSLPPRSVSLRSPCLNVSKSSTMEAAHARPEQTRWSHHLRSHRSASTTRSGVVGNGLSKVSGEIETRRRRGAENSSSQFLCASTSPRLKKTPPNKATSRTSRPQQEHQSTNRSKLYIQTSNICQQTSIRICA
jgi:hypothetical protein